MINSDEPQLGGDRRAGPLDDSPALGGRAGAAYLIAQMCELDGAPRLLVAITLADHPALDEAALPALLEALAAASSGLRAAAAVVLGRCAARCTPEAVREQIVPALADRLSDQAPALPGLLITPPVWRVAADALEQIGTPEAVQALTDAGPPRRAPTP